MDQTQATVKTVKESDGAKSKSNLVPNTDQSMRITMEPLNV